ncbi:MAG: hypothetical protein ACYC8T_38955 [Myxococcaceae bacterium]
MGSERTSTTEYAQALEELQSTVDAHEAQAAPAAPDCQAEHARYDASARPQLQRLRGMDGMMGISELRGMCDRMSAELDRHASAACSGAAEAARAETARHCDGMRAWLSAERERARQLQQAERGGCGCCGR